MRTPTAIGLLVLAVSLTACTNQNHATRAASATSVTPAAAASVEPAGCPPKTVADATVTCGRLTVPERHAAPNGKHITVAYAVLHHQGGTSRPDPILWMDYQAGDGFLAGRIDRFTGEQNKLRTDRDLIVLDLRGEGSSTPVLTCPEYTELEQSRFVTAVPASSAQGRALTLAAVKTCRTRLAGSGIDLAAYNTAETAADLEDLRTALHYPAWNIIAGGYGATVALREMQAYPGTVRSAVLNDAMLPTADILAAQVSASDEAFAALAADCRRDTGCHSRFPDPLGDLRRLFTAVASTPLVQPNGFDHPVKYDPVLMAAEVRNTFGDTPLAYGLPADLHAKRPLLSFLGFDAAASEPAFGDRGVWVDLPPGSDSTQGSFALGKHLSVVCREAVPLTSSAALAAAGQGPLGRVLATTAEPEECQQWAVPSEPSAAWHLQRISTPVLVMHGAYDPLVPLDAARALGQTLPHGYFIEVPGVSEYPTYVDTASTSTASECARTLRQAFLDSPGAPNTSCLRSASGAAFTTAPTPTS